MMRMCYRGWRLVEVIVVYLFNNRLDIVMVIFWNIIRIIKLIYDIKFGERKRVIGMDVSILVL